MVGVGVCVCYGMRVAAHVISEDRVWILTPSLHGFHELSSCRQPCVLSSKLSHRPNGLYCNKYVINVRNERS